MANRPPLFDWMQPRRNPEVAKTEKARRETMYRVELEERAGLLQRLGNDRAKTRARLAANLAWDFPSGESPVSGATLDAIVDRIFTSSSGAASRPTARGKGGTR